MSLPGIRRRLVAAVVALAGVLGALIVGGVPAGAATLPAATPIQHFSYGGNAFGTSVNVNGTVQAGATALTQFGCNVGPGLNTGNSVASVTVPKLLSAGEVTTTGQTARNATTASSRTTSTTTKLNILGGHIAAEAVKSVSTSSNGATGFAVSPAGTTFTNLVVNGKALAANVPPNTTISLGQLGTVTINEQVRNVGPLSGGLIVNGLDVRLSNGTQILVSVAQSSLQSVTTGQLGGGAYGSTLFSRAGIVSGPSALVLLPCAGTNGVDTNTLAGVTIPKVLSTGTVTDTAQGTTSPAAAQGQTTATTQAVNLLGGLVTASAVKADSHASLQGTTSSFSASGSKFVRLKVSGHPEISDSVAPNTTVNLPRIGTLRLNGRDPSADGLQVVMIDLVFTAGNKYGLPTGATLAVSVADTTVHG